MKFGVLIEPVLKPEELIEIAEKVENWDFSSFWYPDEKFYRDCYIGLTLVAHHTQRINIGTCVTEPYARHPIITAAAIGSLAELAPRRTWLGIGAGGRGFKAMGIERLRPAVAIREAVHVIRKLLAGEMVHYMGEVISLNERRLDFIPPPNILIMIATGFGRSIQRLAGEIGDAAMLANYATPETIRRGLERITEGATLAGRAIEDFHLISRVDVAVHPNRELARRAVSPIILSNFRSSFPMLDYLEDLPEFVLSSKFLDALRRKDYQTRTYYRNPENSADLIPDILIDHLSVAGSPNEVRKRIEAIIQMDVFDEITIHPVPSEEQTLLDCLSLIVDVISPNNSGNDTKE